jgi:hypothetical protein
MPPKKKTSAALAKQKKSAALAKGARELATNVRKIVIDLPKDAIMKMVDKIIEGLRFLKRKIMRENVQGSFSFSKQDIGKRIDSAIATLSTLKPVIALTTVKSKIADAVVKALTAVYKGLYYRSPRVAEKFATMVSLIGIAVAAQDEGGVEMKQIM